MSNSDLFFSSEPTARGDQIVSYIRQWYEKNRESWWDRHRPGADRSGAVADNWMIRFLAEVNRIYLLAEADRIYGMKNSPSVTEDMKETSKKATIKKSAVTKKRSFKKKVNK